MTALIAVDGLYKSFGKNQAVRDVSFSVPAGQAYGLVGPDGAGKTTTFRLLIGALAADAGTVQIAGYDLRRNPESLRTQVGYLAQRFSLYGDLTVWENLRFFGEVRGVTGKAFQARAHELLGFVGLAGFESRLAGALSGGMKQKLGLASALLHRPRVLLLDEPTGGVDPVTRQDFWQLVIRLLTQEEIAVLVSTPYMDEAARCNRLGLLFQGKLLVEGAPRAISGQMPGQVLELIAHPKDIAKRVALSLPEVEDALAFGDRLHLRVSTGERVLAQLPGLLADAGVQVERLRPIAPSLEDSFIAIIAQQSAQAGNAS